MKRFVSLSFRIIVWLLASQTLGQPVMASDQDNSNQELTDDFATLHSIFVRGVHSPRNANIERLSTCMEQEGESLFGKEENETPEDKLLADFHILGGIYEKKDKTGTAGIYYALRQGYPYRVGFFSAISFPESLIQFFIRKPILAFDTLFNAYSLIKKAIGNDKRFYSLVSFYIEAISDTNFNWKVIKNPNYLQGGYNEYSEIIFEDQAIENKGAKRASAWGETTGALEYRSSNRREDMKWRMMKFFHRRGPFLSNLMGYYLVKILKKESELNDSAKSYYKKSYFKFAAKYNNFVENWNKGIVPDNPYEGLNYSINIDDEYRFDLFVEQYKGSVLNDIPFAGLDIPAHTFEDKGVDISFILSTEETMIENVVIPELNFDTKEKVHGPYRVSLTLPQVYSGQGQGCLKIYNKRTNEIINKIAVAPSPVFSNLEDIVIDTPPGFPYMIIHARSEGSHCCNYYDFYSLDENTLGKIAELDTQHSIIRIEDTDANGSFEIIADDWTFAYWKTSFVGSPSPIVILDIANEGWKVLNAKMKALPPSKKELTRLANEVTSDKQWMDLEGEYSSETEWLPSEFLRIILDLIYSGNPIEAREFFDMAWPDNIVGKEIFLREFAAQLKTSHYWGNWLDNYTKQFVRGI